MVRVDREPAGQADGCALDAAGESRELVRLDIADDDPQVSLCEEPVGPHRCAGRGLAQVHQVGPVFRIVTDNGVAAQEMLWDDRRELLRPHRLVGARGNDQGDLPGRKSQRLEARQQRRQEVLVGNRPGLVVDGDGAPGRTPFLPTVHDGGQRNEVKRI